VRRDCQSSHAIMGALYSVESYEQHAFTKIPSLISIRSGSV
jgi:hypothetical protein